MLIILNCYFRTVEFAGKSSYVTSPSAQSGCVAEAGIEAKFMTGFLPYSSFSLIAI